MSDLVDLHLKADDEAALAAALGMLRTVDDDGAPAWALSSAVHALDACVPVVTTAAVVGPGGEILQPAQFAPGYFANLRLVGNSLERDAIAAAAAPFVVEPDEPQQGFARSAEAAAPVPPAISDRQFAQVLALDGVVSEAEALAWAARGELPAALEAAIGAIPEEGGARFAARMLLAAATTYERAHPLVDTLGLLLGRDAAALDDIWRRAAAL